MPQVLRTVTAQPKKLAGEPTGALSERCPRVATVTPFFLLAGSQRSLAVPDSSRHYREWKVNSLDCMSIAGEEPNPLQKGEFPPTRWTMVVAAQNVTDESGRRQALSELCDSYWYPLYAFLRREGASVEDAEDLTQGFFAHLLDQDRLRHLQGTRGRLRSYLLQAIKNYRANQHRREMTVKRGGGQTLISIDADAGEKLYQLEPAEHDSPETLYETGWALTLLNRALAKVRADYEDGGRVELFDNLQGLLAGRDNPSQGAELAEKLDLTPRAFDVALHRLRKRYRVAVEAEIAETVSDPGEVEEEVQYLFKVFGGVPQQG